MAGPARTGRLGRPISDGCGAEPYGRAVSHHRRQDGVADGGVQPCGCGGRLLLRHLRRPRRRPESRRHHSRRPVGVARLCSRRRAGHHRRRVPLGAAGAGVGRGRPRADPGREDRRARSAVRPDPLHVPGLDRRRRGVPHLQHLPQRFGRRLRPHRTEHGARRAHHQRVHLPRRRTAAPARLRRSRSPTACCPNGTASRCGRACC